MANNGMTISSQRFARRLVAHGHEVRVLCQGRPEDNHTDIEAFYLPRQRIPIFDKLITSQGMEFGHSDPAIMRKAVEWADIVHFLMPFGLTHNCMKVARELDKPYTAAFHVQAENISSSLHMGKFAPINTFIYWWYRSYVYQYVDHVHCPSRFIAEELVRHHYTNTLHVISNGIDPDFRYCKLPKEGKLDGRYVITMVGRYSIEKRQDVLIRAVGRSKYADRIQLVLAGQGPTHLHLLRMGRKLPNPPIFGFLSHDKLRDLLAMTDLYVHASDMEIEAMGCMEAFASGLVPIIADSPKSATPQFALDERSLFAAGNPDDLTKHIEYWIEHEEERRKMEHAYAKLAERYQLDACVLKLEEMFEEAMADHAGA